MSLFSNQYLVNTARALLTMTVHNIPWAPSGQSTCGCGQAETNLPAVNKLFCFLALNDCIGPAGELILWASICCSQLHFLFDLILLKLHGDKSCDNLSNFLMKCIHLVKSQYVKTNRPTNSYKLMFCLYKYESCGLFPLYLCIACKFVLVCNSMLLYIYYVCWFFFMFTTFVNWSFQFCTADQCNLYTNK